MNFRVLVCSATILATAAALAKMPKNAFLIHPVANTEQLVREVESSRVVMDRYARHFALKPDDVLTYLRSLHVMRLPAPLTTTIYSVPTTGVLRTHVDTIPKGEKIFADNAGNPALRLICGNPLTLGPRRPYTMNKLEAAPVDEPTDALRKLSADVKPDEPKPLLAQNEPTAPAVVEETAPVAPATEPVVEPAPTIGHSDQLGILPILLAGGVLIGHGGGGGGGGNNPVPEPATLIALGSGVALLAKQRKRIA
ncbi:MAG: PEP-CTERM sorting domain-containing protein [Armatimonadetes bacterium]|nr:PEP-CTERM sorting domain-containing protein [Armatimonadota bacterium]